MNYNSNQAGNAGKNFTAKLMIQKEKIPTVLSDVCTSGNNLTTCITTLLNKSEPSIVNIYHHTSSLANGAGDNSYRYAGASESVNNFVCFGSTETPCPTDNLYRIIGVFEDKVKLIKYDYATSALLGTDGDYGESSTPDSTYYKGSLTSIDNYYWNYKNDISINSNIWSTSLLNKINLNTNYINNIGSEWANKIATTTWKVGGNTFDNIGSSVPSIAYQNEIVSPSENTTYDAKIGLMYASDYGFAASPSAWSTTLFDYQKVTANNWMYMGDYDWTISRDSDNSDRAFVVSHDGSMRYDNNTGYNAVRPSFNLSSSITYVSGSGSAVDPILIN